MKRLNRREKTYYSVIRMKGDIKTKDGRQHGPLKVTQNILSFTRVGWVVFLY